MSPKPYRAFFKYFGAKHQAAGKYPDPNHPLIVEPFAGSAAYATRWHDRRVVLVEKDPAVASVWDYLIRVSPSEVLRLPVFRDGDEHIDDLGPLPEEPKRLIGFWLYTGSATPRIVRSSWAKTPEYQDRFWGEHIRERIASQVEGVKHWRLIEGSYERAGNPTATWFVDPPYFKAGKAYACPSSGIDFAELASWCKARRGTAIVCENVGASWLPFEPFYDGQASRSKRGSNISEEAVWVMSSKSRFDEVIEAASAVTKAREALADTERTLRELLGEGDEEPPQLLLSSSGGSDAKRRGLETRRANQAAAREE